MVKFSDAQLAALATADDECGVGDDGMAQWPLAPLSGDGDLAGAVGIGKKGREAAYVIWTL